MATPTRRTGHTASVAEVVLLPTLKHSLVNLPANLVTTLTNANTIIQNVIVELTFRSSAATSGTEARSKTPDARSVYLGWTGMQSQTKLSPLTGRESIRSSGGRQEQEIATVEMDTAFARRVGLQEGMKVSISLHIDPPEAHTIHIEPLTASDWEIIELHSSFLEMNFLNQVRALPNPNGGHSHPLTLHLTSTSTANITVTSLTPAPANTQSFVKIGPNAEVIVAPKTRQSSRPSSGRDSRSVASTGQRSASGRSTASRVRSKTPLDSERARPPLFLRGISRQLRTEWFDDDSEDFKDEGLKIWIDPEHLLSKTLRGVTWVTVSVIKPAGLQEPIDPQAQPAPEQQPATRVVAKLCSWYDAPDSRHVAVSTLLSASLGAAGIVGGVVRIDPAPAPLPRTASALKEPSQQASKDAIVKRLRVTPFAQTTPEQKSTGFRFGGESKTEREESAQRLKAIFGRTLLDGPLTDGMLLPPRSGWPGGILDFDPTPAGDPSKARINWLLGGERKLEIAVQAETVRQKVPQWPPGEALPSHPPEMVGIDSIIEQTRKSLLHMSSVLLTGGLGSGKTSLAFLLAHQLRSDYISNIIYFPCRTLVNDETRVKTIKDTLHRIFASASWGARLGGRSLVILDDLDKLCPVETELQMDSNGRSRQVSELLCTIVREWCNRDSNVVMLATAQSKEAVNSIVVGGHVVRDIVALKAPSKDGRRKVLELLMKQVGSADATNEWMEGSEASRPSSVHGGLEGLKVEPALDLLDVAAQTDGYMPGDLALLVARARSEALIRAVSSATIPSDSLSGDITLMSDDFTAALKGFTPASLRGVTLHSSTTTFAAIGGLKETRQTLLETLQYPTTYAPLFAKCPLRLRSGLLLYGYPGCGKTLLASAVAGECGLNFISVKGPEILNKYIGASEKSVRDLFERAEAAKPCVLFFDEFDSIAPKRGHDSTGVTDRVVNMLLTMMDGAEGLSGVYVLAATSRPDMIDPALLRPGRLDKSLICDMPNLDDRLDILRATTGKLKLDASILEGSGPRSLAEIARRTDGYSGADLQAIMYNAHLEAIQDVLGPGDASTQDFSKKKGDAASPRANTKHHDFATFRFSQPTSSAPPTSLAAAAADRAAISAQLFAIHAAKRRIKAERHATHQSTTRPSPSASQVLNGVRGDAPDEDAERSSAAPIIAWQHLQKSLETTRASISAQDRRRLQRIYSEFVVGRNGDMPDGQGGSEIGGRTSLM